MPCCEYSCYHCYVTLLSCYQFYGGGDTALTRGVAPWPLLRTATAEVCYLGSEQAHGSCPYCHARPRRASKPRLIRFVSRRSVTNRLAPYFFDSHYSFRLAFPRLLFYHFNSQMSSTNINGLSRHYKDVIKIINKQKGLIK